MNLKIHKNHKNEIKIIYDYIMITLALLVAVILGLEFSKTKIGPIGFETYSRIDFILH